MFVIILVTPIVVAFVAITFYKKELTGLLIDQAKTIYGIDIKSEETKVSLFENWPNATIAIKNVTASTGTLTNNTPLFTAKSVAVSFNLPKLLTKTFVVNYISLNNGTISLIKDKSGHTNFNLMQPTDTAKETASIQFNLEKINLNRIQLDFKNEERDKHIGILFKNNILRIHNQGKLVYANLTGNIQVEELLFKPEKGPFLKNTPAIVYLNATFYPKYKSFFVDETSYTIIDGEKYSLVSFVELGDEKRLTLKISTASTDFKKGVRLMNPKIRHDLAKMVVKNPISVYATIIAPIGKIAAPELYIAFSGKNNEITIGNTNIPYHHVSFSGYLHSFGDKGPATDLSNGLIVFEKIKGLAYDFPFTASMSIHDLKNPRIKIKADLAIEASKIKFKPGTDFILKGECKANVNYNGDLKHLNNQDFLNSPQQLVLQLQFKKFSYQTAADQPSYIINGFADGINKDLRFKSLKLESAGGDFVIDGTVTDFVPYAFGHTNGFDAKIQAYTNLLDLTPLIAQSFSSDQKKKTQTSKENVKERMDGTFKLSMGLKAKKLIIRNLEATDADAEMNYSNQTIELVKLNMNACNGNLKAKGTLKNFTNLKADLALKNMDVRMLFEQFENFGQQTISSEKLRGNISLTANMKARLNEAFQLQAPDLAGKVSLQLKDGHLLNFEPFQNIAMYFPNRDFKDITFYEIDQVFKIKGTEMQIQNLQIASSVLDLYIDGIYNFKGQTDLNLRIPLRNLKRRDKDFVPKTLEKDEKTGKALLLNAHGMPNNIKISLGAHDRDTSAGIFE